MSSGVYNHKKGYKRPIFSENWKNNIRLGSIGKKLTDKHKNNISISCKGKKMTELFKLKLRLANLGKKLSEETKKKISLAKMGCIGNMKGKHHTEEAKEKMRLAHKGKHISESHKHNISLGNKGKTISEEQKKLMSFINKGRKHSIQSRINMGLGQRGRKFTIEHRKKISGANSSRWKGGKTSIIEKIRKCDRYKQWRQTIYLRDKFTCQDCNQLGGKLEVHHNYKSFSKLIEEVKQNLPLMDLYEGAMIYEPLWDIDNGITLCIKCHDKVGKMIIIKKPTQKVAK